MYKFQRCFVDARDAESSTNCLFLLLWLTARVHPLLFIDIDCLLKEGRPTVEDIEYLTRDISDNPDELRKFYELLGLSDGEPGDLLEPGVDTTDGAPILRHLTQEKCKNITFEGLAAVLDHSSFNRRDLVQKYCLIQKGKPLEYNPCDALELNFFLF